MEYRTPKMEDFETASASIFNVLIRDSRAMTNFQIATRMRVYWHPASGFLRRFITGTADNDWNVRLADDEFSAIVEFSPATARQPPECCERLQNSKVSV